MSVKRLLVTGSSGMLGSSLVSKADGRYDLFGVRRSSSGPAMKNTIEIDLSDAEAVDKVIKPMRFDCVVHCAAATDIELCEGNLGLARAANATATRNLLSAVGVHARFIYISTDSVFDGNRGNYNEEDIPSPVNNYAKAKLEGERFVESMSNNYVIVRTNIIGLTAGKREAFAAWVFNNLSRKSQINMFTDVIFNPVSVDTLSMYIYKLLEIDYIGRLNIGCVGPLSKYEFGLKLAGACGFDPSLIRPVRLETFPSKARRPKNTSLDLSRAQDLFGPMPDIDSQIRGLFLNKHKTGAVR